MILHDKEKGDFSDTVTAQTSHEHEHEILDSEKKPDNAITKRYGFLPWLGPMLGKLFATGVEARGVERVREDEREEKNVWNK
jgi:ABC-type Zn2+ transport system substrate-binding protein/surface adhesin